MRDERLLDDAIDATARALTAAKPSSAIREHVATRVAAGGPSVVASRWLVATSGVAIALMVATLVLLPDRGPAPLSEQRVESAPPASLSPLASKNATTRDASVLSSAEQPSPARATRLLTQASTRSDEVIAAAEPIEIAQLEADGIDLEPLAVPMAIVIEPITLAPIDLQQ